MAVQELINWVVGNMLLVAILALIFFFGDVIYNFIVKTSKSMGKTKAAGFLIALLMVLVLSLLPVILQGLFSKLLTFWGVVIVILLIIVVSYLKYTRKF
jgi:fatty acid desaturase